jgi:hypothetical protein
MRKEIDERAKEGDPGDDCKESLEERSVVGAQDKPPTACTQY